MRLRRVLVAALAFAASLAALGVAREARADAFRHDRETGAGDDADKKPDEPRGARTPYALTVNPGATLIGHWGGNFEWSPMPGHALVASLAYVSAAKSDSKDSDRIHGVASEIGWRFYTGDSGPVGGFFGPSLLAGYYYDNGQGNGAFTVLGGAVDLGVQTRVGRTILVGAGVGLQTTQVSARYSNSLDGRALFTTWSGILPRALFSVGGAFGS